MTDILKFEARQRIRGTLTMIVVLALYLYLLVYMFPSVKAASGAFEEYAQSMPESLQASFGVEALGTIGGFLSTEVYQFLWVLMMGLYFAYVGGGLIADDIERGRIDVLLSAPVSRTRVVVEKFASLLFPILAINVIMPVVVLAGVASIGESLAPMDLLVLHVISVPYFLVTAGIGLFLSVVFDRSTIAQRGGLGVIFALFTLESVTVTSDLEWLGNLSPTKYFDPTDILVHSEYDFAGALILGAAALALLMLSSEWFRRRDI